MVVPRFTLAHFDMTHVREACAVCIAVLVLWMAYYVGSETGWYWVYAEDLHDTLGIVGAVWLTSAALFQLVKGVLI